MVGCRAVRSLLGVSLIIAALAGPAIATAQETRAPTEAPNKYDEWEQFPPAWEKALRTLGDDTLYLLSSPLRLSPESALVVAGIGAGIAGLAFADRSIRDALAPHRHDGVRDAADDVALLGRADVQAQENARVTEKGNIIGGAIAIGEGLK